jgi:hypothetical protein
MDSYLQLNTFIEAYEILLEEYTVLTTAESNVSNNFALTDKLQEITTLKESIHSFINNDPMLKCIKNISKYNL